MYSRKIVDRNIADVERALGRSLDWYSIDDCTAITASLADAFTLDGSLLRSLTEDEQRFIHDTNLRCQFDALYWMERFAFVRADDVMGGERLIRLWGSQQIILQHIAYCEDRMWASYHRQVAAGLDQSLIRVDGICIALLKARQLGATVLILLLLLHRFIFWTNLREVFASADEKKTLEAFDLYWTFAFNHLPLWMRPNVDTKSKDFGMRVESQDTTLFLQNAAQESGIGMGGTSHCGLITEVGLYPKNVIEQMQNHFFRSIPWSLVTFIVMESLAQGQGNFWHSFSLAAIKGTIATAAASTSSSATSSNTDAATPEVDAGRWHGVFIPWYAERGKYRREPPPNWKPSAETMRYAYRVYTTSHKYVGEYRDGVWHGENITLDAYQLYFYESEKRKAELDGALEDFLTNYPATPEEAFQSRTGSPFRAEVLERLSNDCSDPLKVFEWLDRGVRPADLTASPLPADDRRGLIEIWEKPSRSERYKMAADTSPGIEGWSRRMPQKGDRAKDNAALHVMRVGRRGEPDVQVAQWIAPVNYIEQAPVANWLGRLFRGKDDEMCELVVETGPTSGEALEERLMNEFGYYNLYRRANMTNYTYATSFGWVPNEKSRLDLWYRTRPHMSFVKVVKIRDEQITRVKWIARSRYLVDEEMRNCELDKKLMTAKNAYGFHDDALRVAQMAIYIAHDWSRYGENSEAEMIAVPAARKPDYIVSDMTREEMIEDINRRLDPESGGDVI